MKFLAMEENPAEQILEVICAQLYGHSTEAEGDRENFKSKVMEAFANGGFIEFFKIILSHSWPKMNDFVLHEYLAFCFMLTEEPDQAAFDFLHKFAKEELSENPLMQVRAYDNQSFSPAQLRPRCCFATGHLL